MWVVEKPFDYILYFIVLFLVPVSFLLILSMTISGYSRKKIGTNFGKYHKFGAILLFIAASTYVTFLSLIRTYFTMFSHLCGFSAVIFAFLTMAVAYFRKKIGPEFIVMHQRLALVTLVMSVMHVLAFVWMIYFS